MNVLSLIDGMTEENNVKTNQSYKTFAERMVDRLTAPQENGLVVGPRKLLVAGLESSFRQGVTASLGVIFKLALDLSVKDGSSMEDVMLEITHLTNNSQEVMNRTDFGPLEQAFAKHGY